MSESAKYTVQAIGARDIDTAWPMINQEVARILRYAPDFSLADVYFGLKECSFQCWLVMLDREIVGVCITEVLERTNNKICNIFGLAGKAFKEWEHTLAVLEDWAREIGCTVIRAQVRKGLKPEGFRQTHVVIERELDGRSKSDRHGAIPVLGGISSGAGITNPH